MAFRKTKQTKISAFFAKRPAPSERDEINGLDSSQPKEEKKTATSNASLGRQTTSRSSSNSSNHHRPPTCSQEDSRHNLHTPSVTQEPDSDIEMASTSSPEQAQSPSLDATSSSDLPSSMALVPSSAAFDEFTLTPITLAAMPSFQRLLKTLLPVAYPARFFAGILERGSQLGRVALWTGNGALHQGDEAIGGIKAQLEDVDSNDEPSDGCIEQHLYIQTLGVLAPYRGHGIAAHLIDAVVDEALALARRSRESQQQGPKFRVTSVYAHVWEANDDALGWYRRRGFTVERLMENYYRKLRPAGAWVVRKDLSDE